ncbi:hypothetical protein HYV86_05365 [Candidatus Woesearchaeota archaeon]|nr:hypothetical protein [Candidatus Woesearchaeota archaeon]
MYTKRGIVWIVLVLALITSVVGSLPLTGTEPGSAWPEREYIDEATGLKYAWALGVGGIDDDAKEGCTPGESVEFGIPYSNVHEGYFNVRFPNHADSVEGNDCDTTMACDFTYTWDQAICHFQNLPKKVNEGCYFLSAEYDYGIDADDSDDDDDKKKAEYRDDCAGWFIPIERVVDSQPINGLNFFGDGAAQSVEGGAPQDRGNSIISMIQNFIGNDYIASEADKPSVDDIQSGMNALCPFEKYPFSTAGQERAFVCLPNKQEENLWYICDEQHVGKFIPYTEEQDPSNPDNIIHTNFGDTQKATHAWFCEKSGDEYTWISNELSCDLGGKCDQNKDQCESDENGYAWLDNAGEQQEVGAVNCCGNNGIDDVGRIATVGSDSDAFICVNKQMVGAAGGSGSLCEGEWCWLQAGLNSFKILTIHKPGSEPYDVVSNVDSFVACGASNVGESLKLGNVDLASDLAKSAGFLCYKEGNRYSWAQCSIDGSHVENTVKTRIRGEGVYSLPLDEQVEGQTSTQIRLNDNYEQFYGPNPAGFDFTGYELLDFYLTFTGEVPEQTQLIMTISGKHGTYFQGNILPYVTNGITLESSESGSVTPMHVQIPVGNWLDVEKILFLPTLESVSFTITSPRLVDTDRNVKNPICVGTAHRTFAWLDDVDQVQRAAGVRGDEICNANLGEHAWIENTEEGALADPVMCCGDDSGEYSAGNGESGCWNSQKIAAGETTSLVQYRVISGISIWRYEPKTYQVSATITGEGVGFEPILIDWTSISTDTSPYLLTSIRIDPRFVSAKVTSKTVNWDGNPSSYSADVYFSIPAAGENPALVKRSITKADVEGVKEVYVMANVDDIGREHHYIADYNNGGIITQACTSEKCVYALPGEPPYTITNLHPTQYNLYYVRLLDGDDGNERMEILIDKPTPVYGKGGWLEARQVKQNILYQKGEFYTCGEAIIPEISAEMVVPIQQNEAENMCRVVSLTENEVEEGEVFEAYFCGTDGSWHDQPLPGFTYTTDPQSKEMTFKREGEVSPSQRRYTSTVVPGRNLLYNAHLEKRFNRRATVDLENVDDAEAQQEAEVSQEQPPAEPVPESPPEEEPAAQPPAENQEPAADAAAPQ